jgi:aminoglycoside phosphotransferase (APT) family kinase protein
MLQQESDQQQGVRAVALGGPIELLGIDWRQVGTYLKGQGYAVDLATEPVRLAGGLANINLLVWMDGHRVVFRRPPLGPLPHGAHDMEREHRVLSRLCSAWPLAPRSLHYCADPSIAGAPFQLLEYREGVVISGASLGALSNTPAAGEDLSVMMIDTLVDLHRVDTDAVGLSTLGKPATYLSRTTRGWIQRAGAAIAEPTAACAFLVDWLEQRAFDRPSTAVLLHNDFKLDNIVLSPGGVQPTAVLDWDMATRGDALFDLATLLSYWTQPDDPPCMHTLAQMPTALPGFLSREAAAALYSTRSGRALDDLLVWRVLAIFKLGVVFHQLSAQHGSHDLRYAHFATLGQDLLEFAADVARERRF